MININFVVQIVQEAKVSCSIKHSFRCHDSFSLSTLLQSKYRQVLGPRLATKWRSVLCVEVLMLCPTSAEVGSLVRLSVSSWGSESASARRMTLGPASTADLYWAPARPRVPTTANVCQDSALGAHTSVVRGQGTQGTPHPVLAMAWVRLRHDGCYLNSECVGLHDKLISDINCLQHRVNTMAMHHAWYQQFRRIKWIQSESISSDR